jgi:lysophospholipase L1-like esterase
MSLLVRLLDPVMARVRRTYVDQFDALPRPDVDLLFIGDSITAGAEWGEWLPGLSTANRGIPGDRTVHVLNRLDSLGRGRVVCVLIGTNDLGSGTRTERIAANVRSLIDELRRRMPESTIVLQSVMPRQRKYATRIAELNALYREIARDSGATYVDLWPAFDDGRGGLRAEFTPDKLHLNGLGYAAWVDALSPITRRVPRCTAHS